MRHVEVNAGYTPQSYSDIISTLCVYSHASSFSTPSHTYLQVPDQKNLKSQCLLGFLMKGGHLGPFLWSLSISFSWASLIEWQSVFVSLKNNIVEALFLFL